MRFAPFKQPIVLLWSLLLIAAASAYANPKQAPSKTLQQQRAQNKSVQNKSVQNFALGLKALKAKNWAAAKTDFNTALKGGSILSAEIYEKMAEAEDHDGKAKSRKNMQAALEDLQNTLNEKPNRNVSIEARFSMSKLELKLGQFRPALYNLRFLQWRSRFSPKYPDILVTLLKVELKENRRYFACRWARELYARFPAHPQIASWGVDLVEDKLDNMKVGCPPSQRDIETRMERLQLAGHADKAKREIDKLRAEADATGSPQAKIRANMLLVQYYEMQGYPYEALQILVKYYAQKKYNLKYQEQLGRVAAQADEFQSAIGAFDKAYRLSPYSSEGRWADFSAAYLSYQIQDYDGADQRFMSIIRHEPGSYFAQQARWQLAWIDYLKGHYKSAEDAFRALYQKRIVYWSWWHHRKHWWVRYPYRDERTRYWLAMSFFRQKKYRQARTLFSQLAKEPGLTYYSFLAKKRLSQIAGQKPSAKQILAQTPQSPAGAQSAPTPQTNITGDPTATVAANSSPDDPDLSPGAGLDDSDDTNANGSANSENDGSGSGDNVDINGEPIQVSTFKDPKLRLRFTRASELMKLGLSDWANGELFDIERRTRNKTYLHMLMAAYVEAGSYGRAVDIAQDGIFEHERQVGGLSGARGIWQFAFPRAYAKFVKKNCKRFGVPEQMVWAIMRAESRFNPNAISAVGARGLVQLMPYTAEQLEKLMHHPPISAAQLIEPQNNIELGTRYLARLLKQFDGYVPLVAAAYNAGPQRVYSWLHSFGNLDMDEFVEHIPFVETREYVKKVVRNYILYSEIYHNTRQTRKNSVVGPVWLTSTIPVKIDRKPSPRENWQSIE